MVVARVGEDTVTSAEMPGAPEGGGGPKGKGRYDGSAQGSMAEGGLGERQGRRGSSDSREEGGAAVGGGPVLEVEAEVVAADEGLEAGAELGVAVVLPELDRLVDRAVAVAEVGRERVAEVDAQALLRAEQEGE